MVEEERHSSASIPSVHRDTILELAPDKGHLHAMFDQVITHLGYALIRA